MKGTQVLQIHRAGLRIAGAGARLDHGRAFPVLAHGFIIGFGGERGNDQGCRGGVWPKSQIDAKDVAIGGCVLQQSHEIARQAHEAFLCCLASGVADLFPLKEQDEIDIARVIQLPGAKLAQTEDDQATVAFGIIWKGERNLAGGRQIAEQVADGRLQRHLGKLAEGRGNLLQRPKAGDVRRGDN
jgi:hypothetical protein